MPRYILILILFIVPIFTFSQQPLNIGDQLPDWSFKPLVNETRDVSLSEYKGKVILIGFWSSSCSVCLNMLPKLAELQSDLKKNLKILLISESEDTESVKSRFERRKHLKSLGIPLMIKDIQFEKLFPHDTNPHVVIVDTNGKIVGITGIDGLEKIKIEKLFNGERVTYPIKELERTIDSKRPAYTTVVDSTTFMYNSILTKEVKGLGPNFSFSRIQNSKFRLLASNLTFMQLYSHAYNPLVKINPNEFHSRIVIDNKEDSDYDRRYCYELIIPINRTENMNLKSLAYMQQDLDRFFQVESSVEKRNVSCYVISSKDSAGSINENEFYIQKWLTTTEISNAPISTIAALIKNLLNDKPVVVEGNLRKKFSMILQQHYNNLNELRNDLTKHGIDINIENKVVDFLIIKN